MADGDGTAHTTSPLEGLQGRDEGKTGGERWRRWPLLLVAAAIVTTALAATTIALILGRQSKPRHDSHYSLSEGDLQVRSVRLADTFRDSFGATRITLASGEHIIVDSASVELRSNGGQLLQQLPLPLAPLPSRAALRLLHDRMLQGQLLPLPQQQEFVPAPYVLRYPEAHHPQPPASRAHMTPAPQASASPVEQQLQPNSTITEAVAKPAPESARLRTHVRRLNSRAPPNKVNPILNSAESTSTPASASVHNSIEREGTSPLKSFDIQSKDGHGTCSRGGDCSGGDAAGGSADFSLDNTQLYDTSTASDSIQSLDNGDSFTDESNVQPHATPGTSPSQDVEQAFPHMATAPDAYYGAANNLPLGSAPRRGLLATQAVGSMATVADALAQVGQAMMVGPMTFASTFDAAGALMTSPSPPVVATPLQVTPVTPLAYGGMGAYGPYHMGTPMGPYARVGTLGRPYAYGCGSFDPNCMYSGMI